MCLSGLTAVALIGCTAWVKGGEVSDHDWLKKSNIEIGAAESAGTKQFFEELLAPAFAFRRASGVIVNRTEFIDAIKPSARRDTKIEAVTFLGDNRALVTCIVTMEVDGERRSFHNVRLFVRRPGENWKLLAWANEAM